MKTIKLILWSLLASACLFSACDKGNTPDSGDGGENNGGGQFKWVKRARIGTASMAKEGTSCYTATIGNKIYYLSYLGDLWEYDVANNIWSQKQHIPTPSNGVSGMYALDGVLHVTCYYTTSYIYDPQSDSWEDISSGPNMYNIIVINGILTNPPSLSATYQSNFITKGTKAYCIATFIDRPGGGFHYYNRTVMCEYDTTTGLWTEKASVPKVTNNPLHSLIFWYGGKMYCYINEEYTNGWGADHDKTIYYHYNEVNYEFVPIKVDAFPVPDAHFFWYPIAEAEGRVFFGPVGNDYYELVKN